MFGRRNNAEARTDYNSQDALTWDSRDLERAQNWEILFGRLADTYTASPVSKRLPGNPKLIAALEATVYTDDTKKDYRGDFHEREANRNIEVEITLLETDLQDCDLALAALNAEVARILNSGILGKNKIKASQLKEMVEAAAADQVAKIQAEKERRAAKLLSELKKADERFAKEETVEQGRADEFQKRADRHRNTRARFAELAATLSREASKE